MGTKFTFLLSNGVEQESGMKCVLDYMPWIFGLGTAVTLTETSDTAVTLVGSAQYAQWSSYVDRHGERPSKAYPWSDTLSPTLGARYRWYKLITSVDLSYSPSPVPEQSGRTNYVDNDRVSGGLGAKYSWNLWGAPLSLGAQMQAHYLVPRNNFKLPTPTSPDGKNIAPELVKDEVPDDAQLSGEPLKGAEGLQTNNPGWPGFKSTGLIFGGSIYLGVSW